MSWVTDETAPGEGVRPGRGRAHTDEDGRLRVFLFSEDPHAPQSYENLYDPDGNMVARVYGRDWTDPRSYVVERDDSGSLVALHFRTGRPSTRFEWPPKGDRIRNRGGLKSNLFAGRLLTPHEGVQDG